MICSLKGLLSEVSLTEAQVDVGGVGYQVFIPMSTFDKLPRPGAEVRLLTYMNVREDAIQLYGFATKDERQLFEILMSVSGIGPKLALNVLSSMTVPSFCAAVANGDVKVLSKISGIGKKTAERMVLELKNKIKSVSPEAAFGGKIPDKAAKSAEDAVLALVQLGFKYETAAKAVHELAKSLPPEECTTENMIRKALGQLNT